MCNLLQIAATMESDLPDSILSFIFNKLSFKDRVKTSLLSKHWLHEWRFSSTTHLNFDLYNTPATDKSQFTARLDQFMLHYQHARISSIRVKFPLGDEHSDVIDRLISEGIAKGVKHIQLLFSHQTNHTNLNLEFKPYRFPFTLLSNTDSLTYLHLENCLSVASMDFSGLKNLTTLVLQQIVVKQDLLESLLSNCIHLADFTLDNCELCYYFKIITPTLVHLKIVNCRCIFMTEMDIIAPNLSSLEYSFKGEKIPFLNIEAHALSHFSYKGLLIGFIDDDMSCLKNLTTIVLDGIHRDFSKLIPSYLFNQCLQLANVTLKNCSLAGEIYITSSKLRHLNMIDCGSEISAPYMIYIDAKNLSSFEYSGVITRKFSVMAPKLLEIFLNASVKHKYSGHTTTAPKLLKVFWNAAAVREENRQIKRLCQF